jgi:hypothetical protein
MTGYDLRARVNLATGLPDRVVDGRWIVESVRRVGDVRVDGRLLVERALTLRNADTGAHEFVHTFSLPTTEYSAGQTVYGTCSTGRENRVFKRAAKPVGRGR